MSFFESVSLLPDDPILHLPLAFALDKRTNKVNLGIGTYRDALGKPLILTSVKKAESDLVTQEFPKEYLPIEGSQAFLKNSLELVFGKELANSLNLFAAQTIGGTGALKVGGDFLSQETSKTIFLPHPTWPNHRPVFTRANMKVHAYRYFDENQKQIDFNGLCKDLSNMPPGSTILFHACCHNPTGVDLSFEQWKELSLQLKKQNILPFFDLAYQGFDISLDEDAKVVRYFASQGHEMLVASSFSKNFGLYSERVGMLSVVLHSKDTARKVGSQIRQIIRSSYSNPPSHGSQTIAHILQTESLKREWIEELCNMRDRIKEMRKALIAGLQIKCPERDWNFLRQQKGFFSFCGLTQEQAHRLIQEFAIYLPSSGRMNIAGLNIQNIDYVIDAIHNVL